MSFLLQENSPSVLLLQQGFLFCGWNAGVGNFVGFDCSSSYHVAFTRLFGYLHEALLGFRGILNGLWMKG